jgi:hypothetical protein
MTKITKTLAILATAATLVVGAVAAPQSAEARGWRGHGGGWHGGGYGYGVGAFAAGALVGAAVAGGPYYYGEPAYYGGPGCYWTRERVWDGYGWRSHRVQVCG